MPRDVEPTDHSGLVAMIAARHTPRWTDREEVVQAGNLGLVEACEKYREARGVVFFNFAYPFIKGRIIDASRQESRHRGLRPLHEGLLDPRCGDPAELAATRLDTEALLAGLAPRERAAVRAYFGLDGWRGDTNAARARSLGLTKRQLEVRVGLGLQRLRHRAGLVPDRPRSLKQGRITFPADGRRDAG